MELFIGVPPETLAGLSRAARIEHVAKGHVIFEQGGHADRAYAAELVAKALTSPADLGGLPSLDLGPPHREHQWQLDHEDGQTALIPHRPRLVTDDMAALRDAALAEQSSPSRPRRQGGPRSAANRPGRGR